MHHFESVLTWSLCSVGVVLAAWYMASISATLLDWGRLVCTGMLMFYMLSSPNQVPDLALAFASPLFRHEPLVKATMSFVVPGEGMSGGVVWLFVGPKILSWLHVFWSCGLGWSKMSTLFVFPIVC